MIDTSDVEQPNIDYIVRVVNRKRQRLRPEDPKDLDFEVYIYIYIYIYIYSNQKNNVAIIKQSEKMKFNQSNI